MNCIVVVGAVALIVISVGVLVGFTYLQDELDQMKTEEPTPTPATSSVPIRVRTFTVYRWWDGNVTLDMLYEYEAGEFIYPQPVLCTYRLNSTAGMVAYYEYASPHVFVDSSTFEKILTNVTARWTKTLEQVSIPWDGSYGVHPEYARFFP
jgi:hypothetical protein